MDEIDELAETVKAFLSTHSPISRVLASVSEEAEPGFDRKLWKQQAELGWTGILIPESAGGSELGFEAMGRLVEVCGRYVVPEPYLATICLSCPPLLAAGDRGREILTRVASGDWVVALAVPDLRQLLAGESRVTATQEEGGWRLRGEVEMVIDAPEADRILVAAATAGGLAWFALEQDSLITRNDGVLLDGRRASRLQFDDIMVGSEAVLAEPSAKDALGERVVSASATLVSSWLLGITEQAFEVTLAHLRSRIQFGVPIGSFQALQHRMAKLYCELEVARAVVESALQALDAGDSESLLLASAAKARMGELAMRVTGEAIQLHGGMGMTEEGGVGIFYKAARVADMLAGSHSFHQERASALLGIARVPLVHSLNGENR